MSRVFFFFFLPFLRLISPFFFFNDTATTEIYTLSLHDALPISPAAAAVTSRNSRRCIMASSLNRKIAFPLSQRACPERSEGEGGTPRAPLRDLRRSRGSGLTRRARIW